MFTTPPIYLATLGGIQVGLLWMLQPHLGIVVPALATTVYLGLLASLLLFRERWEAKLWAIAGFSLLTAIVPTVIEIANRFQGRATMLHDGNVQVEVAVDKLMHGQPIYGVDWSQTPLAAFGEWTLTPGGNPALHHFAYYPLTVLVGIPFRLVTDALGVPFDYRIVLIAFAILGLIAILALPISRERRFMVITAIYASPLITLYLWSGRSDIEFLAVVLLTLALLTRGHPVVAAVALGVAVALKPFAWVAVPFFLMVLLLRWQNRPSRRELIASLAALAAVPAITIAPFFLANPAAFWADIVLYTSGGVADAYPIAGYGLGALLYALHVIGHRTDSFPFGIFQLLAALPVLYLTARAFLRRPTLGRWMAGYASLLLAVTFFARFFNDSYAGLVITLLLCVLPLGDLSLRPAPARPAERLAA